MPENMALNREETLEAINDIRTTEYINRNRPENTTNGNGFIFTATATGDTRWRELRNTNNFDDPAIYADTDIVMSTMSTSYGNENFPQEIQDIPNDALRYLLGGLVMRVPDIKEFIIDYLDGSSIVYVSAEQTGPGSRTVSIEFVKATE